MEVMVDGGEEAISDVEHAHGPGILLRPSDRRARVDLVDEFGIMDVDFVWIDSHDWALGGSAARVRLGAWAA